MLFQGMERFRSRFSLIPCVKKARLSCGELSILGVLAGVWVAIGEFAAISVAGESISGVSHRIPSLLILQISLRV
jgi:hypothetical protein